jgi:hypothetical protein
MSAFGPTFLRWRRQGRRSIVAVSGVSREEPEHPFSPREGQLGRTYWSSSADKNSRPVNNLAWGHIRLWSSRPVASIDLWFHVAWLYWCVMTKFVYGLVLAFALVHLHRTSLQAQAPNNAELMGRVFLLKYGATSGTAFVVTVERSSRYWRSCRVSSIRRHSTCGIRCQADTLREPRRRHSHFSSWHGNST